MERETPWPPSSDAEKFEAKDNVIQFPQPEKSVATSPEQVKKDNEELVDVWNSFQMAPEHLSGLSLEDAQAELDSARKIKKFDDRTDYLSRRIRLIKTTTDRFNTVGGRYYDKYKGQLAGAPTKEQFMHQPLKYIESEDQSMSQAA